MADCPTEVEVNQPSANMVLVAIDGYVIEVPNLDYDIVIESPTVYEVEVNQPQPPIEVLVGIPGESQAGSRCIYKAFTWETTSPLFLGSQLTSELVQSSSVVITEAFDGAGATVALGDTGDAESIFGTTDVKLGTAATFECPAIQSTTVLRHLFLTLSPGTATQGAGFVLIQLCEV